MKRRTFINQTVVAGLTGATIGSRSLAQMVKPSSGGPAPSDQKAGQPAGEPAGILRLKGAYYRHHSLDFSLGHDAALGMSGWGESVDVEAPVKETALISMHNENIGLIPEIPYGGGGPMGEYMKWLEYEGRKAEITKTIYPKILRAARAAGIPVIHIPMSRYGHAYPGYERAVKIAGPEPKISTPRSPGAGHVHPPDDRKAKLLFGEHFKDKAVVDQIEKYFNFPEQAKPVGDEFVTETSHQLSCVLNSLGAWNLIYIGFAINWCLWFSPCGMTDLSRLGYRCSCIKEAVTAVENKESIRGEQHKEEAMWRTSLMFGYIFGADDFIGACGRV